MLFGVFGEFNDKYSQLYATAVGTRRTADNVVNTVEKQKWTLVELFGSPWAIQQVCCPSPPTKN